MVRRTRRRARRCIGATPGSCSKAPDRAARPAQAGPVSQYLTVFVADVDAHCARTQAAGARIVEDLNETVYGERQYVAEDLEGYRWLFSQHIRDVSPDEWGATVFRG